MNEAHIHLMINHLPVVGLLVALGVVAFAVLLKRREVVPVGLWLVLLASLSAVPAYLSGEGAEEVVEHQPGVSEALIHDHEELAELALVLSQVTGLMALGAIVLRGKKETFAQWAAVGTLVAGMVTMGTMGVVANSGGKIQHPELRGDVAASGAAMKSAYGHEEDDDDD